MGNTEQTKSDKLFSTATKRTSFDIEIIKVSDEARKLLNMMTSQERYDLFNEYCRFCGSKEKGCQCWNDE